MPLTSLYTAVSDLRAQSDKTFAVHCNSVQRCVLRATTAAAATAAGRNTAVCLLVRSLLSTVPLTMIECVASTPVVQMNMLLTAGSMLTDTRGRLLLARAVERLARRARHLGG
jgi:hypothetical protein